jgi:two-component system alkaline phosphatase synthesis response regulator PhoP
MFMKILCLSQDEHLSQEIREEADNQKWSAVVLSERSAVMDAVKQHDPDMLLVDLGDDEDLQWWQDQGLSDMKPVLFLNQEITEDFMVRAFECGADGMVPKPIFSRRFLVARVNAYIRRRELVDNRLFVPRFGLVLDSQRYLVEIGGKSLSLTLTEFKILRELASDREKVVKRSLLQERVFAANSPNKRSLDVHVCALRKKLRPHGIEVESIRAVGYRLSSCAV